MPSKVLHFDSPYSLIFSKQPNYKSLRIFGCLCYPFVRPYNNHKLQYRSIHCLFLGYSPNHKGYLCLNYKSGRVYITPHVVFDETMYPLKSTTLADKQIVVETQIFPLAFISLPSQTCHATHSVSNTTQGPIIDFLASIDDYASYLPSFVLASQTPAPTPSPIQRMTTRAMRGITKKKQILDLTEIKVT